MTHKPALRNPEPKDDPVVQALIDIEQMTKPIGVRMSGEEDRGVVGRVHRIAREALNALTDGT